MKTLHAWDLSPEEAMILQKELAARVRLEPLTERVVTVAGVDCAPSNDETEYLAVAVVWDLVAKKVIATNRARVPLDFEYIPGLLSFRECPAVLAALDGLHIKPDVVMCDGQGVAHPRRLGIASHLGLWLGIPTLGCAKKRLVGERVKPGPQKGDTVPIEDEGETLGVVLRSRDGVKPIYVSPGHLMTPEDAERIVLSCLGAYRLPEPTRYADRLVAAFKRGDEDFEMNS